MHRHTDGYRVKHLPLSLRTTHPIPPHPLPTRKHCLWYILIYLLRVSLYSYPPPFYPQVYLVSIYVIPLLLFPLEFLLQWRLYMEPPHSFSQVESIPLSGYPTVYFVLSLYRWVSGLVQILALQTKVQWLTVNPWQTFCWRVSCGHTGTAQGEWWPGWWPCGGPIPCRVVSSREITGWRR